MPRSHSPSTLADAVVEAALAILVAEGPEGLTIRALAAKADVAPMSIYNHFGGKSGVLDRIWIDGFTILGELSDTTVEDPKANLLAGAHAYRKFAHEYRGHYTVMFVHRFVGYEPSPEAVYAGAKGFELLLSQVAACQAAGYFSGRNITDLVQQLWAAVHGYVSLELLGLNFVDDRDAAFLSVMEALFAGLNADSVR